ncbi:hypothetical protein FQA39_LY12966 [Lamprigera yunnana]|nr:hypothetical protein FQA39_LY12966 [Lamprigera yunnana]
MGFEVDLDPEIKEVELEKLKEKFEISVVNTTKGTAVEEVVKYLELDDDVKVYAFGDGSNDISMFKSTKYPIAMQNGLDALKEIAHDITEFSNEEDGVAKYILKNILV